MAWKQTVTTDYTNSQVVIMYLEGFLIDWIPAISTTTLLTPDQLLRGCPLNRTLCVPVMTNFDQELTMDFLSDPIHI